MKKSNNDSRIGEHNDSTNRSPISRPQDRLRTNAYPSTLNAEGSKDESKDQEMLQASMGLSRRDIELRKRIAKKFGR